MSVAEVNSLIDSIRRSTLSRAEQIELWESTYTDQAKLQQAREVHIDCVGAVLDAAGLTEDGS